MGLQNTKLLQGQQPIYVNHSMFQNARVLEQKGVYFMTTSIGIDEKQYIKWKQILTKSNQTYQYLLLPKNHQFGGKGLCGSAGTVNISYDCYPYILMDEIESRHKRKSKFQQPELWFLLYVLCAAQQQMKFNFNTKIGDVRPHNIFVNQDGQIKISCLNSWPRQKSNFQKSFQHQNTFLAPEQMNKLQLGGSDDVQSYQSELFSIGMSILSAALLNNFNDIYNAQKLIFDYEAAQRYLHQWKNNKIYSDILTAVVCNLCNFSPQKRLSEKQLWLWICQYEIDIKNKDSFVIKKAPTKIEKQIQQLRTTTRSSRAETVQNKFSSPTDTFYRQAPIIYQQILSSQRFMSPIVQRVGSPVYFNMPNGSRNIVMLSSRQSAPYSRVVDKKQFIHQNILHNEIVNQQPEFSKIDKKPSQLQPGIISNGISVLNKQLQSQQVQTFFSPPQSIVSQKGGDFVYTRRIVNPTTNSLLGQESINESQYHQGIIEKNLQAIQQKNSVSATYQGNNQSVIL